MPENFAELIVATLKVVNAMLGIFVDLGANPPLTNDGSILVNNLGVVAVTWANTVAQLFLNNPI